MDKATKDRLNKHFKEYVRRSTPLPKFASGGVVNNTSEVNVYELHGEDVIPMYKTFKPISVFYKRFSLHCFTSQR